MIIRGINKALWISVILCLGTVVPLYSQEEEVPEEEPAVEEESLEAPSIKPRRKRFKLKLPPEAQEILHALMRGEKKVVEAVFRPMEFREPIATIPAEGRFGVGFYGWKGLNP
ncbi:MAG TPA: hypothetical protein QGF40_05055, partial [Candidatus Marinimicrobia bacterium]|nr:hypothetical protein [Candidatus Neomarinimicrobiota bacterium]